jgi:hypothetical protein
MGAAQASQQETLDALKARATSLATDTSRSRSVTDLTIELPGLRATFSEGVLHPVADSTGYAHGAVFLGKGSYRLEAPAGRESEHLEESLGAHPLASEFTTVYIRATAAKVREALGLDGPWSEGKRSNAAVNTHNQRHKLLKSRMAGFEPRLEFDWMLGEVAGDLAGHALLEFKSKQRLAGPRSDSSFSWLSYLHNPRGALFLHDDTTIFAHKSRSTATQDLTIGASWNSGALDPGAVYDIEKAEIDLVVAPPSAGTIVKTTVKTTLSIAASETPVPYVALDLVDETTWCLGDDPTRPNRLVDAVDAYGHKLASVQLADRILAVPSEAIGAGGATWTLTSVGHLSETITGTVLQGSSSPEPRPVPPGFHYTVLGGMAWYPRNPRPDKHRTTINLTLPATLNALATGRLVRDQRADQGRSMRFEETQPVLAAAVNFGAFKVLDVRTGSGTQLRAAVIDGTKLNAKSELEDMAALVGTLESLWGPYPFDALSAIEVYTPLPSWTCPPPDQKYMWEGMDLSYAGVVNRTWSYMVPPRDSTEAKDLQYLYFSGRANFHYLRAMAKQWWGQAVHPATEADRWFVEAMAQWSATLFLRQNQRPAYSDFDEWIDYIESLANVRGIDAPLELGWRLGTQYPRLIYATGPLRLRDLQASMGEEAFVATFREAFEKALAMGAASTPEAARSP